MKIEEQKIKKILIIRPNMIGDVISITPAISALRKRFPNAKITLLIQSYTRDVIAFNKEVDEILIDDIRKDRVKNLWQYFKYVQRIREKKFDLCINYFNSEATHAILPFLAGIPYRVGDKARLLHALFYNLGHLLRWQDISSHEIQKNLQLLEPLGIHEDDPRVNISVSAEAERSVLNKLSDKGVSPDNFLIGIHLGTGGGNRPWSTDKYVRICDSLASDLGAKVVITGGKKEKEIGDAVYSMCKAKPVNMVMQTNLAELIALIKNYKVFIGVDSGPLHIAAGLGVPTVAIFTTKNVKPSRWGPWNTKNIVIHRKIDCKLTCFPGRCRLDTCLKQIDPKDIVDAVKYLLAGKGNNTNEESAKDWFKKTLSTVITCSSTDEKKVNEAKNVLKLLNGSGYHVALVSPPGHPLLSGAREDSIPAYAIKLDGFRPASIKMLLDVLACENTNLLHRMDNSGSLNIFITYVYSGMRFPASVQVIKNGNMTFKTAEEVIKEYQK